MEWGKNSPMTKNAGPRNYTDSMVLIWEWKPLIEKMTL